jgi:hypothetical protein
VCSCHDISFAWKNKKGEEKTFQKTKNIKTKVVCNPDFKLLVALGAPRSAFLADFQPPGASKSPPGLEIEKNSTKHIHENTYMCI